MSLQQVEGLYIANTGTKGRGVFTSLDIPRGAIIELCPVIVLPAEDKERIHQSLLHDYYFLWEGEGQTAIALGYGSLYNHSDTANADYEMEIEEQVIVIKAIQDIAAGEEICIDYTDGQDRSNLWF